MLQPAPIPAGRWIYALPGTHLGGLCSAGAPDLELLAAQEPWEHAGRGHEAVATESAGWGEQAGWRAWILYGTPDQALAELLAANPDELDRGELDRGELDQNAQGQLEPGEGHRGHAASLRHWRRQMELATQAKRRWREQLQLIHLGQDSLATATELERELPELELGARQRRSATAGRVPAALLQLAAFSLLQADAELLKTYLDLEGWADQPSPPEQRQRWRSQPVPGLILSLLQEVGEQQQRLEAVECRMAALERQQRRDRAERQRLSRTIEQLEHELEHYVSEHLQLDGLVNRVEEQLLRARRLLEP